MRRLYTLVLSLLILPLLAMFWWRGRHDRGYRKRWNERFALQRIPESAVGGIVVHAVSVGEVAAALPLIRRLRAAYPALPLTVTCTTPTGSARIRAAFGDAVHHCYLPFDLPGANRRFLEKLQPRALVILETELWPNLLAACRAALIPVIVANARLSAGSAKGYRRFYRFTRDIVANIDLLLAQDRATARRFTALGLAHRPQVCGNLKFDHEMPQAASETAARLAHLMAGRRVWVAGSTHAGEDEQLIAAARIARRQMPDLLLVLVPRHPDRFDEVARLLAAGGMRFLRRAEVEGVAFDTDAVLVDAMGELGVWYALADLIFVGGSLIPRGGHNPLEAMCLGKAVQSGPHVHNFAQAYQQLDCMGAVNWVRDAESLAHSTLELLQDPQRLAQQGEAALALYREHGGASERMVNAIRSFLGTDLNRFRSDTLPRQTLWWQRDCFERVHPQHFDPAYWQAEQAVIGASTGRNTAWFIRCNGRNMVLRHYYRGGLIAKLSRDRFLRVPVLHSRAMQEFSLLQRMSARGLPVPRPCAARMVRDGLTYRADLLIELIPDAHDLATILSKQHALTAQQWQRVGQAIARLHGENIYHSDLNCHNILLDAAGKIWLIDFDKCAPRAPGKWKRQNLERLLRSLRKEKGKLDTFHWTDDDWQSLLLGYAPGPG